jgi:hypothetical protein
MMSGVQELRTFVADLPKVELHIHHVGSASPRIVAELATRHEGTSPVPADPDLLREYFDFQDFAHFIEIYLSVVDLIRTPDDVSMLTYEIARESGTRCTISARNGSDTESRRLRIPHSWPAWRPRAFRWRSARRPTFVRGRCRPSRSTHCLDLSPRGCR